jgi:alpha-ketoglutaric semialdehyde dehydrogenase
MEKQKEALATEAAVAGALGSSGQRCTATSRVVVEEVIADRFVDMLVARAKKLKIGNGLDADVDVAPLVDEQQWKTVLRYLETGEKEAKLLLGGERMGGANTRMDTSSCRRCSIACRGTARSRSRKFSGPCCP